MCIPFPYDQELSPDREHIHLVALVFSSTLPCYERVIRRYFDLFDFPIGQQHQGHHVLFKARGEHFQIIHDLNMLKHFHWVHIVPWGFHPRRVWVLCYNAYWKENSLFAPAPLLLGPSAASMGILSTFRFIEDETARGALSFMIGGFLPGDYYLVTTLR